jgi:hypothetical protein
VRRALLSLMLASASLLTCCAARDPRQEVELLDLESYWAVDASVGDRQYIAPVVRFQLRNRLAEPLRSLQATATFRRKGEENLDWGNAFSQVLPAKKPLQPGQSTLVTLKSDGRYYSTGQPEGFFENQQWKDAHTTVFVRIGASSWVKFAETDIERRIGARSVEGRER